MQITPGILSSSLLPSSLRPVVLLTPADVLSLPSKPPLVQNSTAGSPAPAANGSCGSKCTCSSTTQTHHALLFESQSVGVRWGWTTDLLSVSKISSQLTLYLYVTQHDLVSLDVCCWWHAKALPRLQPENRLACTLINASWHR